MALFINMKKAGVVSALAFVCLVPLVAIGQSLPTPPAPATAQQAPKNVQLTLPQVRKLAVAALRQGQPKLAYKLADGLLKADPKSSFAHFTKANAEGQLGMPGPARRSAAKAYRYADSKLHRFEAAELAARLSYADKRPTQTQLWLRRAVQNAPNAQVEAQLGRDYGVVRAQNKLSFSLRGGLRPSSNVNNGADSAVQVIDGLPYVGTLSGSAQALSGVIGTVDATLKYRLRGTKRSRTELSTRLYMRRVRLDSGARALATDGTQGDFGNTFAEVKLSHNFALGNSGNGAHVDAALGQFWSGRNKAYAFARIEAGRNWKLGAATQLTLDGSIEKRVSNIRSRFDSTTVGLRGGLQHKRPNGDRLSFALSLRQTDSDSVNLRMNSQTLSGSYAFAKQFGPAKISASLAVSQAAYDDFTFLFEVPGGRQDKSVYANVNFFFPDLDYAGFAPRLTVTAGRKFSNVSRYETEELSVSLGIQSKF